MSNYQVDRQRWAKLTIHEQLGNIGSEVGRSIKAKRSGDNEALHGALQRALDLFDATTETLVAQHSPRSREVLRAKDQYLRLFYDGTFDNDADKLDQYFTRFALTARKDR